MDPALHKALYPEDSYAGETYWADLPVRQRNTWIQKQANAETVEDFRRNWNWFKKDPLLPFFQYWNRYVVKGLGLFMEGYILFSIGSLSNLYSAAWPSCFSKYTVCSVGWNRAIQPMEIVGIICGQIMVGIIGDWVGRKFGLVQDAVFMFIGSLMLTAAWGLSLEGFVIMYTFSLFVYGFGVGGEYPMTATQSMEGAGRVQDRLHRGRNVTLAFTMQGWGQLFNQGILIVLLLIFNHHGYPPYEPHVVQPTFRIQFALMAILQLWLVYFRGWRYKSTDNVLVSSKRKVSVTGYDSKSLGLASRFFWHRLVGTAGTWFCNDFFFYGNKIFAGTFISIIAPGSKSVMIQWLYNLINIGVSLVGYYFAAFFMDHKHYGRKRMQAIGFLACFILFVIAAALFNPLQKPGGPIRTFQFIYFFSSFWNQFGPNATTFLLAAEVYPAPIRGTAHGVSAAIGKLGALAPTILYNYVDNQTKFWVVTWFGLAGYLLTVAFIPDTTGLDLREQERYWRLLRAGRGKEYHGRAVHPRHISWYERFVLGLHKQYDPKLDAEARLAEMKESALVVSKRQAQKQAELQEGDEGYDSDIDSAIIEHFAADDAESANGSTIAAIDRNGLGKGYGKMTPADP